MQKNDLLLEKIPVSTIEKFMSTSNKWKVRYFKKIYGCSVYEFIKEQLKNIEGHRCVFCGRLEQFEYIFKEKENKIHLEIKFSDRHICDGSKECPRKYLNPNSKEYVSKVYGCSEKEALKIIHNRNKSPFYRENHKSEEDYKKSQSRNRDWYIKMDGNDERYYHNLKIIGIKSSKQYIYANNSKEDAEKILKKKDSMSIEFFKKKYGKEWEKYRDGRIKKCCNRTFFYPRNISKESLKFFEPLLSELKKLKIKYICGDEEFFIKTKERFYYYDLCIPSLKIIIEYHGSKFHYNPNNLCGNPYGISLEERKNKDELKRNLALNEGFEIYEFFDTDNKNVIENIIDIVYNKLNIKKCVEIEEW